MNKKIDPNTPSSNPNKCFECKKDVSERAKYCSDRCRIAYSRRMKKGDLPEHETRTTQTRTFDFDLTRTDSLFEKETPNYYVFKELRYDVECINCKKKFDTRLELSKTCSPKCQENLLNILSGRNNPHG